MTNEELIELYKQGNKNVLGDLYFQNEGMIRKTAVIFSHQMEYEDAMQESFFAVQKAVESFNPNSNTKFSTWLFLWLKGHLDRVAMRTGTFVVSYDLQSKYRRYNRVISDFQMLNGTEPDSETICYLAKLSADDLEEMRRIDKALHPASTDKELSEDGEETIADFIPDSSAEFTDQVIDSVQNEELSAVLWSTVDELPRDQALTIKRHFQQDRTLREISEQTGIPYNTIHDCNQRALRNLKRYRHRFLPYMDDVIETKSIAFSRRGFWEKYGSSTEYLAVKMATNELEV